MDYSGKIWTTCDLDKVYSLIFSDKECSNYLGMSAQDLACDIDRNHDFDDLFCDMVDNEYYVSTASRERMLDLMQWLAINYRHSEIRRFLLNCDVDKTLFKKVEFINESKKSLYESIMKLVSKEVKKALNEATFEANGKTYKYDDDVIKQEAKQLAQMFKDNNMLLDHIDIIMNHEETRKVFINEIKNIISNSDDISISYLKKFINNFYKK